MRECNGDSKIYQDKKIMETFQNDNNGHLGEYFLCKTTTSSFSSSISSSSSSSSLPSLATASNTSLTNTTVTTITATTATVTLTSTSYSLLQWQDMPEHLQFNPYIHTGYRPLQSVKGCLYSLFHWHNETINIVSHGMYFFLLSI